MTFLSESRTAESPNPCSLHPPCTITTTVRGAPDYRHETTALHEEVGSPSTTTESSGCKLTWELRQQWRESPPRADMTPISGWRATQYHSVTMEQDFACIEVVEESRYWLQSANVIVLSFSVHFFYLARSRNAVTQHKPDVIYHVTLADKRNASQ